MNLDYLVDNDVFGLEYYTPDKVAGYDGSKFSTKVKSAIRKSYRWFVNIIRRFINHIKFIGLSMNLNKIQSLFSYLLDKDKVGLRLGIYKTTLAETINDTGIRLFMCTIIGSAHYFKDKSTHDMLISAIKSVSNLKMDSSEKTGSKIYDFYKYTVSDVHSGIHDKLKLAKYLKSDMGQFALSDKECYFAVSNMKLYIKFMLDLNRKTLYYYERNKDRFEMGESQQKLILEMNTNFYKVFSNMLMSVKMLKELKNREEELTQKNDI